MTEEEYSHYSKLIKRRDDEIVWLKEKTDLLENQILEFEESCHNDAKPIMERICRRVIARIRRNFKDRVPDDYLSFNALDYIAYEWGCHGLALSEIFPDLKGCIEDCIAEEIGAVHGAERTVLTYSHLNSSYEPDSTAVESEVFDLVMKAIDEHSQRGKVFRHWEKNG